MKAPVGLLSGGTVCVSKMERPRPDKFYKCFQIVKTQKISSGALLM